ncbi:hypothetical protein ABZ820_33800 [Streptomyces diacarni]|uniref:hypothetical protein n=1 Tax=Streptomyces diacarni TaxID=2800381 RepID=UPI0033CFAE86
MHARSAADAMARLVRELSSGRAGWEHPQILAQAAEDLARVAESVAAAAQQMSASPACTTARSRAGADRLRRAGTAATEAAVELRQARRVLR